MTATITVDKNLRALAEVISKDEARPALKNIDIKNKCAEATDGYMLATLEIEADDCRIPGELVKKAKMTKFANPVIDVDEEKATLTQVGSEISIKKEKGDFPPTKRILDVARENNKLKIGLGLKTLEPLVRLMKKAGNETIELSFSDDPLQPVHGKSGKLEIVLMPVRIYPTSYKPE